ncbi:PAS domain S-box-containing protein [Sphingobium sp. B2D3A]|uniref:sensor histidine kinase n=1 Tax=unclassified Sphingobium TaxID=2611147 RepID=UPI00222579AE|nr:MULTISPECIES: PAS domain-containing protein [unclassified Sphingobium]MCW2339138.1 PAS domain S-box-containing protein [Sphingobium sp. B2D3A]MCW2370754.1 PAS domain S-box-containing protein [Sphingobium sp. B11D3D]MCW2386918.1 PAS domain S-box-containing protein [Sphingobium sp. B2D3D]
MKSFDLPALENDATLKAIADFASKLCDAPIALVSFVEATRQWFPARTGLNARETPREQSFCAHAMLGEDIMVVPDAQRDPRFRGNPLVTGEPHIRFYAGAPLVSDDGIRLGALCVIDSEPRSGLTVTQRQGLKVLAANIMLFLISRRSSRRSDRELHEREAKFRVLADTMPQMVWSTRPDGFHDYYNARWYEFTGVEPGSTDGEGWNGMFHPDDQERAWSVWRHSLESGDPYEIEYRLRNAHGEYRWTLGRALPIRDNSGTITRWFGTCTDIHDQKMIQAQREVVAQELSHRIKNIFSVITGLISFSTRHHPEARDVANDLRDRIMALGRAHDFVRPHSEASRPETGQNSLLGMLRELLGVYVERVHIEGEDVTIDDRSATPLALVFHELATNAAKYGSLSVPEGTVHLRSESDNKSVRLEWHEVGGPAISQPANSGFGTQLIELSAIRQLSGKIERDWNSNGLRLELTVPCSSLHRAPVSALRA